MLWTFSILSLSGFLFSYLLRRREVSTAAHGLETIKAKGL
jgi:hypothetical protein